ncbi:MAG: hypothetical protein ACHQZQ_06525 [SAR324 cluster bacterium]
MQESRLRWIAWAVALGSFAAALGAGFAGALVKVPMPWIAARVWGGVALLLAIALGLPGRRTWVGSLRPAALCLFHTWRILPGVAFLLLLSAGTLPGPFARVAGCGELLVGLSAPLVGFLVPARSRAGRATLFAWQALGLVELLGVMGLGIHLHRESERLLDSMSRFPLFLMPLYAVPVTLAVHVIAGVNLWPFRRLRSGSRRDA